MSNGHFGFEYQENLGSAEDPGLEEQVTWGSPPLNWQRAADPRLK